MTNKELDYKQELIKLLDTDEQVQIERTKLDFGTRIILKDYIGEKTINQLVDFYCIEFRVCVIDKTFSQSDIEEVIGLPLQPRFIQMYCLNKGYNCNFQNNNLIMIEKVGIDDIDIKNNKQLLYKLISYDLLKDFDNQSQEVYKQIFLILNDFTNE